MICLKCGEKFEVGARYITCGCTFLTQDEFNLLRGVSNGS